MLSCFVGLTFVPLPRPVIVHVKDIADHLPPCSSVPPVSRPTGIFRQLTEIPGLGVSSSFSSFNNFSSSSRAGVSSSSSASIPWRLRQVAAVELPRHARAAADDVVLVLVGGGRVRAGAVAGVPLAEVAGHEVRGCRGSTLDPASLCEVSSFGHVCVVCKDGCCPQFGHQDAAVCGPRCYFTANNNQCPATAAAAGIPMCRSSCAVSCWCFQLHQGRPP